MLCTVKPNFLSFSFDGNCTSICILCTFFTLKFTKNVKREMYSYKIIRNLRKIDEITL